MIPATGRDGLEIAVDATLSLSSIQDTKRLQLFALKSNFLVLTIFSSPSDVVFNATFIGNDDTL